MATSTHTSEEAARLREDVDKATTVLQKLTSSPPEALGLGAHRMPKSELHFCSGIVFTTVTKGGAGLSYEHGRGFLIAKLPAEKQAPPFPHALPWTWSAPLFITVNAGGFGVTLGVAEIDSITILDSPEAVKTFSHGVTELDTDLTASAGARGASLPATAVTTSDSKLSSEEFTYSLPSKGALFDVSLTGVSYKVDTSRNEAVYGALATPEAILDGGVRPPHVFIKLYTNLDAVMKEFYQEK